MSREEHLALSHVTLLVGDHDDALAFCRDVVGLMVRADAEIGIRWLTVGPSSQPGLEIVLEVPAMHPDPEGRAALERRLESGAQSTLIFTTADCDAPFDHLRARGATVGQEPTDQPYGVRDCSFRDPWGKQLRFSQQLAT